MLEVNSTAPVFCCGCSKREKAKLLNACSTEVVKQLVSEVLLNGVTVKKQILQSWFLD